jgi:hypothetical protein
MMHYLNTLWQVLLEAAPFLLLGFFFAGIIKIFLDQKVIQKHLGKSNFVSVFKAALFGIPLPLCSCGVLPAAISLRKEGAGKGPTTAFLISTPESGVDSVAVSYALLDPFLTIARPIAAFITALSAGTLENFFPEKIVEKKQEYAPMDCCAPKVEETPSCCANEAAISPAKQAPLSSRLKDGLSYAFKDLVDDISFHLAIGLMLAAAITFFLPENFFEQYLNDETLSMFVMLLVGIPMYICATASTPVAAALILKGLSPGAALVFLLAGPATNIASLVLLKSYLGAQTLARMLATVIVLSLGFGFLANFLYDALNLSAITHIMAKPETHLFPHWMSILSALILCYLIFVGIYRDRIKPRFSK